MPLGTLADRKEGAWDVGGVIGRVFEGSLGVFDAEPAAQGVDPYVLGALRAGNRGLRRGNEHLVLAQLLIDLSELGLVLRS